MEEYKLFENALELESPWYIKNVEFKRGVDGKKGTLTIEIDFPPGSEFLVDGEYCKAYDTDEKTWQHLNFFQHICYIQARIPRVKKENGDVVRVVAPWARPRSGFTLLMESFQMLLIKHEMPYSKGR